MFFDREFYKLVFHYIFFLCFIIIFIKFSTASYSSEVYKINKIEISEKFELEFNKNKIINKAFKVAFNELISKITLSTDKEKLRNIKIPEIKNLIESFAITDEKFVNNLYVANFEVEFDKHSIIGLLEKNNVIPSMPIKKDLFIIPLIIKNDKNEASLYSENPFYSKWKENNEKKFLISYILPTEDLEDINLIRKNIDKIENYNFQNIIKKYNTKDFIVVIFFENQNELNVLSKVNIGNEYKIINSKFKNFDINNFQSVNEIIKKLKITYENEWKKINQINSSINLTITLELDNNNFNLTNSLEQKLSSLDLVANYYIDKFNDEKIIYKVIYNNTPDKFIEEITSHGFNIDVSSSIWSIK